MVDFHRCEGDLAGVVRCVHYLLAAIPKEKPLERTLKETCSSGTKFLTIVAIAVCTQAPRFIFLAGKPIARLAVPDLVAE